MARGVEERSFLKNSTDGPNCHTCYILGEALVIGGMCVVCVFGARRGCREELIKFIN